MPKFKNLTASASGVLLVVAPLTTRTAPVAAPRIDFDRDIRPILAQACLRCHGGPKPRSHFRLDAPAAALAGGDDNTNDIVPGSSRRSLLIAYVSRQVKDMEMPPLDSGPPLTAGQISQLRAWIDQGPVWGRTNPPPAAEGTFTPVLRQTAVQGSQGKYRELQGMPAGPGGGVQEFSAEKSLDTDTRTWLTGHALEPDQNLGLEWGVDRTDTGYIHAGFDQWRRYYATDGGFDPAAPVVVQDLNRDLHVDNGRAWVEFGLDQPRRPAWVLGYEFQYRMGNESTLDWGYANGKNLYPATQSVDEKTHTFKLDMNQEGANWQVSDSARVSFYTEKNTGNESSLLSAGGAPGQFVQTSDSYRQVQGMNTLMLERQIRDWWVIHGGFYYARLAGSDLFQQTTAIPAFGFQAVLASQPVTLSRQSEIFSVANLFTPAAGWTLSLDSQNEWTTETGFGEAIPDLELGGVVPAASSLDELKTAQSATIQYAGIPFTRLFADARTSEDDYQIGQAEDLTELQRQTAASAFRYEVKAGWTTSPWVWLDWTTQYDRRQSVTDYQQLTDVWQGLAGPLNGYPAFILNRGITTDGVETRLVWHPRPWLQTTLSYQYSLAEYTSQTDPAADAALAQLVSAGGFVADGFAQSQTLGLRAVVTPRRGFYLASALTYTRALTETASHGDPSVAPYAGNVLTLTGSATWALNAQTSCQLAWQLSRADYGANNGVAGIPAGLNYSRQDLILGLSRKLGKNWTGSLRYEFAQYLDPGGGNVFNYTANSIVASLGFRWR